MFKNQRSLTLELQHEFSFISFFLALESIDHIYQGCHSKNTTKYNTALHLFLFFCGLCQYINHIPLITFPHQHLLISFYISDSSSYILYYLERGTMSRPGDWNCRSCQHMNFQRRDSCQRCGDSKYGDKELDFGGFGGGGRGGSSFGFTGSDVRPGDWYCGVVNCGAHNFASRSSCFKCGAFKDDIAGGYNTDISSRSRAFGGSAKPGWKSGDWICNRLGCNEHNFASRMECFKCCAPRDTY